MYELQYDPNVQEFRLQSSILINNKKIQIFGIHDYYPTNRFDDKDLDLKIKSIRQSVWDFKDGRNLERNLSIFHTCITKSGIDLTNSCIVSIPASEPERTERRFKQFTRGLSDKLGVDYAFKGITSVSHPPSKGSSGGNKIEFFTFRPEYYKEKKVVLIDDLKTSSTTLKQTVKQLLDTGAVEVTVLLFGFTIDKWKLDSDAAFLNAI